MGNQCMTPTMVKQHKYTQSHYLNVISLNYSGILLNPFQFYQSHDPIKQKQQNKLSSVFQGLLKQYCDKVIKKPYDKSKFKWNIGDIDKKMQKQRYSPLYNQNSGLINKKLISQEKFRQQWKKTYDLNVNKVFKSQIKQGSDKKTQAQLPTQEQALQAQTFDWLCYLAIVKNLYNTVKPQQVKDSSIYEKFMNKMFSKPFLNEKAKLKMTLKALQQQFIDIAFIQESNQDLVNALKTSKKYMVYSTKKAQSIIVVRSQKQNSKFNKFHDSQKVFSALFQNEEEDKHNWNKDTMYAMVDNYILICAHLSSKEDKNKIQRQYMYKYLTKLKNMYPGYDIILGADANTFLSVDNKQLHQFPTQISKITTRKKRTFLQPQVKKAQQVAQTARDFIITTLNIDTKTAKIVQINGQLVDDKTVLPNENHPYDHFAVLVKLSKE